VRCPRDPRRPEGPRPGPQPLATTGPGVLGAVLAIAGILDHLQTLITDAGDIIIPFTFVMLVDWLSVQRRRTPAAAFLTTRAACATGVGSPRWRRVRPRLLRG
jgi:purine-cytosine permease-like protein